MWLYANYTKKKKSMLNFLDLFFIDPLTKQIQQCLLNVCNFFVDCILLLLLMAF